MLFAAPIILAQGYYGAGYERRGLDPRGYARRDVPHDLYARDDDAYGLYAREEQLYGLSRRELDTRDAMAYDYENGLALQSRDAYRRSNLQRRGGTYCNECRKHVPLSEIKIYTNPETGNEAKRRHKPSYCTQKTGEGGGVTTNPY